jgi:TonB family protein
VEEAFARELLRRIVGGTRAERPEWMAWLGSREGQRTVPYAPEVEGHLTEAEQRALDRWHPEEKQGTHRSVPVKAPELRLPIVLPAGLGEAILKKTRCRDHWIGLARVSVDAFGRVTAVDLSNVNPTRGCDQALETMLRLSLATPDEVTSSRENALLLVVKPQGRGGCFDEGSVENRSSPRREGITPPVVTKRVEPRFPSHVIREMGGGSVFVVVEADITKTGCIRDMRLISQSQWPALNSAALLAIAAWKFKPGMLDGVPVDVAFHVSVNFEIP